MLRVWSKSTDAPGGGGAGPEKRRLLELTWPQQQAQQAQQVQQVPQQQAQPAQQGVPGTAAPAQHAAAQQQGGPREDAACEVGTLVISEVEEVKVEVAGSTPSGDVNGISSSSSSSNSNSNNGGVRSSSRARKVYRYTRQYLELTDDFHHPDYVADHWRRAREAEAGALVGARAVNP